MHYLFVLTLTLLVGLFTASSLLAIERPDVRMVGHGSAKTCNRLNVELAKRVEEGYRQQGQTMGDSAGMCLGAKELERLVNYAIRNLRHYQCYHGEYDATLESTRAIQEASCDTYPEASPFVPF